jgi:hypothetical protein
VEMEVKEKAEVDYSFRIPQKCWIL